MRFESIYIFCCFPLGLLQVYSFPQCPLAYPSLFRWSMFLPANIYLSLADPTSCCHLLWLDISFLVLWAILLIPVHLGLSLKEVLAQVPEGVITAGGQWRSKLNNLFWNKEEPVCIACDWAGNGRAASRFLRPGIHPKVKSKCLHPLFSKYFSVVPAKKTFVQESINKLCYCIQVVLLTSWKLNRSPQNLVKTGGQEMILPPFFIIL